MTLLGIGTMHSNKSTSRQNFYPEDVCHNKCIYAHNLHLPLITCFIFLFLSFSAQQAELIGL